MALDRSKLIHNSIWHSITTLATTVVKFATIPILARVLTPEDFGIVAVIMSIIAFTSIIFGRSGLTDSIIYFKKRDLDVIGTVFWFNNGLGVMLAIFFVLLSENIAAFLNIPNATIYLLALVPVYPLSMFVATLKGILLADMKVAFIAKSNAMCSVISTIIAISMALNDFAIWSLVVQQIVMQSLLCICLFIGAKDQLRYDFSFSTLKRVLPYATKLTTSELLIWLSVEAPLLIVTKVLGATSAGLLNVMTRLSKIVQEVFAQGINVSFFTGLSNVSAGAGSEQKQHELFWVMRMNFFLLGGIYLFLMLSSFETVSIILGDQYSPHWEMFFWIAASFFVFTPLGGILAYLKAIGRTKLLVSLTLFNAIIVITLVSILSWKNSNIEAIAFALFAARLTFSLTVVVAIQVNLKYSILLLAKTLLAPALVLSTAFLSTKFFMSFSYLQFDNILFQWLSIATVYSISFLTGFILLARQESKAIVLACHKRLSHI